MHSIDKAGRRWHSKEFKREAVLACRVPGVSLAAVALEKRINANLLRRWVKSADSRASAASLKTAAPDKNRTRAAQKATFLMFPPGMSRRPVDPPHALAPATGSGLEEDRITDALSSAGRIVKLYCATILNPEQFCVPEPLRLTVPALTVNVPV